MIDQLNGYLSGRHCCFRAAPSSKSTKLEEVSRSARDGGQGLPHPRLHPDDQLLVHRHQGRLLCGPRGQLSGETGSYFQYCKREKVNNPGLPLLPLRRAAGQFPLCKRDGFQPKGRRTRQSKQCGFSIYIFDNSKSKSMVRFVSSEKMALSGLVFARKIARMILIQNI